jgi:GTP cyclohydrolase I
MISPEALEIQMSHRLPGALVDRSIEQASRAILVALGENPGREGLARTPARYAKALRELCSGYGMSVADAIGEGVFAAEGEGLVSVRDVEFHSLCEHHLLPFWGRISVAYYPTGKILGLSKVPRIVECFARRLQVQERLTRQVAEAVMTAVAPRAVAVRVVAEHMCMRMRGVEKTHGDTATEILLGGGALGADERGRLWSSIT